MVFERTAVVGFVVVVFVVVGVVMVVLVFVVVGSVGAVVLKPAEKRLDL